MQLSRYFIFASRQRHKIPKLLLKISALLALMWDPGGSVVKNPPAMTDLASIPGWGRFSWRRAWQPMPVFLSGKSHRKKSLVGYSPQGHKESDMS